MFKTITLCLAVFLSSQAALVAAQDSASQAKAQSASAVAGNQAAKPGRPVLQDPYPRYQIVPGDTMDLVFEFSPEFNQTVTVQPDGFISLRGVPDMHVSSETVPQVIAGLQASYGKILSDPAISVVLKDFDRPSFTAIGQVGHPGRYVLHGETSLTEGLAMAGGFTEKSKHSKVVLFRKVDSQWTEARVLDVKKMLNSANLSEDYRLRPGDMIFVPQNAYSKFERYIPTATLATYISPTTF